MGDIADYTRGEPKPIPNQGPSMHDLVVADIFKQYPGDFQPVEGTTSIIDELMDRKKFGLQKYGTTLQANNGRDPLRDALDEILDLLVYLRQAIAEYNLAAQRERYYVRRNPIGAVKRMYDVTIQNAITLKFLIESRKAQQDDGNS